jgi:hypothetical protein
VQLDLDLVNRRYFALIREARISDRRTFQQGLFDRGLIGSVSCRDWEYADYKAGINAVQEVIDNADAA